MQNLKNTRKYFFFFLMLFMAMRPLTSVFSEESTEEKLESESGEVFMNIGEVTVQAQDKVKRSADLPGSVDIIGSDQIDKENARTALDLLRLAPGIDIGDYNSGGVPNGFTLRGFGKGSHGRHTAVTIDGIPYNYHMGSADGAIDLNQLMSDDIENIVVVKGPIDARYANWARAGIIHFNTRKRGDFTKAKLAYGSFDTQKAYLSIGKEHFDNKFNQVYSVEYYDTDGYRDNSDYKRQNVYGKWFYRPKDDLQLGLILHAYDSDWHTAGYLPEYIWEDDPKGSIQEDDGGWKELKEAQVHIDWDITERMPLEFKVWAIDEDYSRWANWGGGQTESHYEHKIYGNLANLGYDMELSKGSALRLDFGYDYRYFKTQEQNYDTTYRHRTALNKDNEYIFEDLGFYTKANFDPFKMLRLFAGIRYDTFDGESENDITGADADMEEYDVWTYSGGAILTFLDDYSIYGNMGTGFTLPRGSAKYHPNGPDEADLFHWEFGFKARPIEWMLLRYAYFQSKNDDEIRWSAGEYRYEGETLRRGHEVELSLMPIEGLEVFGAFTYEEATYEEGVNDGNWVPGVPKHILKIGAEYTTLFGTAFRIWYRDAGKWYTTSDNQHSYEGYEVVDLKISHSIFSHWNLALDVKNLFDEDYSEYVGYWTDPFGVADNQYAGSDGVYCQVTLKYDF